MDPEAKVVRRYDADRVTVDEYADGTAVFSTHVSGVSTSIVFLEPAEYAGLCAWMADHRPLPPGGA